MTDDVYLRLLNFAPMVCPGGTRHGRLVVTQWQALSMAAGWIAQCRNLPPTVHADKVFASAIPSTLNRPPCCPAAGIARYTMMAAFRTLTRGEG